MANLLNSATTSEPFNVRNYGAIGDGVADDSTAINAALTAAGNFAVGNGGATVVIPPGKYKINSTLVLKDNCTLMAYGAYIFAGGVVFMLNGYTSTGTGYTGGHNNLTILGGVWDAKAQDRAALDAERYNIMTFSNSRGVTIKDVTFRNVPGFHAVDLNTIDGVVIDSCRFEGFRDNSTTPGSRFFSEAVQVDNRTGADLPCINVTITKCYMGPAIDGTGHGSFGKLTGSHTSIVNQFYTNIKVIGNTADSPIDVGIEGENWKNSVVSGNTIISPTNDAIRMVVDNVNNNCSGLVIADNVCDGYGRSGIAFDAIGGTLGTFSDCTISGNMLKTTSAIAPNITLENVSDSAVTGNTVIGGASHGVLLASTCNDMTVTGNNIRGSGVHGIQVQGGSRHLVNSNRLYDISQNGIYLTSGTSKSMVSDNSVIGAGRLTNNIYGALALSNNAGNANNLFSNNRIQKFGGGGNEALTPVLFDGSGPVNNEFRQNSFDGWSTTYISNFTLNGAFLHDGERTRYVVKSADESITNTTFQNDDHLTLPVATNAVYVVEGYVAFNAPTAGDIKAQFTGPASSTIRITMYGTTTEAQLTTYDVTSNPASSSRAMGGNDATDMSFQPKGTIVTGGTAGSITLQWAQFAASGTTIVRQNSWLKITRVS